MVNKRVKPNKNWTVYIVRCVDRSLYCGITNNIEKRLRLHNAGTGAKYTRSRRPVKLIKTSETMSKRDALKLEYRIKHTPTNRKLAVLEHAKDQTDMKNTQTVQKIQNELRFIIKSLQQLTTSVGAIVAAIEDMNSEESLRPKTKRAPLRKKVVVKNGVVEKLKKVPSTKIVHDLLQKSHRGLDVSALMKATGYTQRKIYNITFRLKKEGKIKNTERGVYKAV